jgi:hypothetical protein
MLFFLIAFLFLVLIAIFIVYSVLRYTNSKDWPKKGPPFPYSIDDIREVFRLRKAKKEDLTKENNN